MSLMGILSWCGFGLVVGALARLFMPGRQDMGILLTMLLGVVGSFAGGAMSSLLFGSSESLVNPAGWVMSILGALVVLFGYLKLANA